MPAHPAHGIHRCWINMQVRGIHRPRMEMRIDHLAEDDLARIADAQVVWWRHSKVTGDSTILGQGTRMPGAAVRPASSSSSTPGSKGTAQTFIASRMASDTMLTEKASVSRIFRPVSFCAPLGRYSTPRARMAGSAERQLKKLKGAAFTTPSFEMVVTSAMGRHHGPDQQLVALARGEFGEIEGHGVGKAGPVVGSEIRHVANPSLCA